MTDAELYPPHFRMSVCVVLGRWKELEVIRRAVPEAKIDWAWREALLQTHLFAGFPRLVEAYGVIEKAGGCGLAVPEESEAGQASRDGSVLFSQIYGDQAPAVRQTLSSYSSDFATMIEQHAYARVLMRPGLTAAVRELLSVTCLIALDQPRQLMSHARGALHCGATVVQLRQSLIFVQDLVNEGSLARAERVIERVASLE